MPRARSQTQDDWQTAAASETGSGCLSFYVLPPLAALIIAGFVAFVALKSPLTPKALPMNDSTALLQTAAPPISDMLPGQAPAVVTQSLVSPTQAAGQFPETGVVKVALARLLMHPGIGDHPPPRPELEVVQFVL